jgi:hypothetical protein
MNETPYPPEIKRRMEEDFNKLMQEIAQEEQKQSQNAGNNKSKSKTKKTKNRRTNNN